MRFLAVTLVVMLVSAGCTRQSDRSVEPDPFGRTPYILELPHRFPAMDLPVDNPMTVEGVVLGRHLFHDRVLSGDNSQSCADCHQPSHAFSDPERFSIGIDQIRGERNAMPVINIGWMTRLFWDGRVSSAEQQALEPVVNPIEMHDEWGNVVAELSRDPTYVELFEDAFGPGEITPLRVVYAIAQFERTLISADSRYDRFLRDEVQLNDEEVRGRAIFFTEKGDCFHCHGGILFTDNQFHNNGLDAVPADVGLESVSGNPLDRGKFKTPTLRNIELTAPYMHDGRFNTLEEVVDFYSEGLKYSRTVDALMKNVHSGGVHLTDTEKNELIAFLKTLTDTNFTGNPEFQSPF